MSDGTFTINHSKIKALPSRPIVLATVATRQGTAKLFLSKSSDSAPGRSLIFRLPSVSGKGQEVILAQECDICEKGAIISRKSEFVLTAIPSRVPQVYVVTKSGTLRQLNSAFGHDDWFWVTKDRHVVFAHLDYKNGPNYKRLEQYQLFNPNTLNFEVVSIEEAKRRKIDFANRSSSR